MKYQEKFGHRNMARYLSMEKKHYSAGHEAGGQRWRIPFVKGGQVRP